MASPLALSLDDVVPPLVAHLPGANLSSEPPSSVYPLLAPILRQRLKLLSGPSQSEPWVSLLTWTPSGGAQLASHLSKLDLSPHPASGEVETGHVALLGYRRLDIETLEAAVRVPEMEMNIIYHWIASDPDLEGHSGWKVMDVHVFADENPIERLLTIFAAEEAYRKSSVGTIPASAVAQGPSEAFLSDDDGDDDYWNSYDNADSHAPPSPKHAPSDDEYFSRFYGDVSEETNEGIDSPGVYSTPQYSPHYHTSESVTETSSPPLRPPAISHPTPPTLPINMFDVPNLEKAVVQIDQEIAIKQHISATLKSLYRLAKATGISRADYEEMIKIELSILPMLDDEEC